MNNNRSKIKKLILLFVASVLSVPVTAAFGIMTLYIGLVGFFVGIAMLIGIAFTVEYMRKRLFSGIRIAHFILCGYLPGFAVSIIFCVLMLNLPRSSNDIEGWGALARGVLAFSAAATQSVLALIGTLVALNSNIKEQK